MAWKLNRGDWSEAYVFLKLLAEGRIYSGDEDLNKIVTVYMDILKIIRKNKGVHYEYAIKSDYIEACDGDTDMIRISVSDVARHAN